MHLLEEPYVLLKLAKVAFSQEPELLKYRIPPLRNSLVLDQKISKLYTSVSSVVEF